MNMTVYIPTKLKELVEGWLRDSNRVLEHGGFFFGTPTEFVSFLPVPNKSNSPSENYHMSLDALEFAEQFAKLIRAELVAGLHTHPNGTIPSEADKVYIQGKNAQELEIIIADQGEKFTWFCIDKELRHVPILTRDETSENLWLMMAESIGLIDFGRVMMTLKGELLFDQRIKNIKLLMVDEDAFKTWSYLERNKKRDLYWRVPSIVEISRELKISPPRVKAALKRLELH